MAVPRLAPYIKQQLNAGYDINTIKDFLIRNGYDIRDVNEAAAYAYKPVSAKKIPVWAIAGVIGAALVVVIILFFSLGGEEAPKQLIDLETSALTNEVGAGKNIGFNVALVNMGAAKRYDVSLSHDLTNSMGLVIETKQETMALETRAAKVSQMTIPENAASGSYSIKTTAMYDGQMATSSFTIRVKEIAAEEVPSEIPGQECPSSCDDFNECTRDYCGIETSYQCVNEPIIPCCGNMICDSGESNADCPADCKALPPPPPQVPGAPETILDIVYKAKEMAATSPDNAADYCAGQEDATTKDSCHLAVGEIAKQSKYCEPIVSLIKKDSCYTTAALNGDYTVCTKMNDQYLRQSCFSLAQASAAEAQG